MGYLDQLKQQAAQVKAKEMAEGRNEEQLQDKFDHAVLPTMHKLHQYMHEMTQQLNYIKPDTTVSYEVEGYGTFRDLAQNEYILGSYDKEKHSFFVRIFCHAPHKVRFDIPNQTQAEKQKEYLWKNNIPFKWGQTTDKRQRFIKAVFELKGEIIIEFTFSADYDRSAIKLNARNFAELGQKDYIIPPEKVTDEFLDKLAMYITRATTEAILKPYEVGSIWGTINNDPKEKLRRKILEEQQASTSPAAPPPPKTAPKVPPKKPAPKPKKPGLLGSLFGKK